MVWEWGLGCRSEQREILWRSGIDNKNKGGVFWGTVDLFRSRWQLDTFHIGPFSIFILTAIVTLEGVNKCSSFDCLGRRLGPRLLGRVDDSGQRLVKDFYKILNQVNAEEIPDGIKLPDSFNQLVSEMKNNQYDAKTFALMLRAMAYTVSLRLTDEYSSNAHARRQLPSPELLPVLSNNSYHHFVLSTDNILAASVVVNSAVQSSLRPEKIVFHIITDKKTYAGMHAWGKSLQYYSRTFASKLQARSPKYISLLNHLRIYLPELFPNLDKVVFLDDDVVIQRDLSPLWEIDLWGKVNGAVETCKGEDEWVMSKHFRNYFNFSHPLIAKHLDPDECAWAYGMNIFDLRTWRKTNIRENISLLAERGNLLATHVPDFLLNFTVPLFEIEYHHCHPSFTFTDLILGWAPFFLYFVQGQYFCTRSAILNLKSNLTMWKLGTLPPALIAFKGHIHPIDPSWHMLGLGYQTKTIYRESEKSCSYSLQRPIETMAADWL
ncbi:hypothetical protein CXB51_004076 [Gossypium anomalum]|uniref:Hexosyltransferase n=1 Tax=Gossypium anomalum TaxID=47600 RepID=A0A8J5ZJ97_9ROSI|nr:hypothetical protein CXB51_004076 [Gossypium anomalum]